MKFFRMFNFSWFFSFLFLGLIVFVGELDVLFFLCLHTHTKKPNLLNLKFFCVLILNWFFLFSLQLHVLQYFEFIQKILIFFISFFFVFLALVVFVGELHELQYFELIKKDPQKPMLNFDVFEFLIVEFSYMFIFFWFFCGLVAKIPDLMIWVS